MSTSMMNCQCALHTSIFELVSSMAPPYSRTSLVVSIPPKSPSIVLISPSHATHSSLASAESVSSPLTPSKPLYFRTIREFYTSFIPCLSLLQALRTELSPCKLVSPSLSGRYREATTAQDICSFVNALASLCDVPYVGDTCTALAISDNANTLSIHVTANTSEHAHKAAELVRRVVILLQNYDPGQPVQANRLYFAIGKVFSTYRSKRERVIARRSKDPGTFTEQ